MNTYAEKNFSTSMLLHTDIARYGQEIWVKYENIKPEWRSDFDSENEYVNIFLNDIDYLCIDPFNIEYGDWDNYVYKDFINSLIKPFNHYLVCAYHCTWDRRSGYKITDSLEDAFYRSYECSQYYTGGSSGGKSIVICEHSHDVPMGHETLIVGLTDKEYEKLSYWDVDFETIFKFADSKRKLINPLVED